MCTSKNYDSQDDKSKKNPVNPLKSGKFQIFSARRKKNPDFAVEKTEYIS